MLDVAIVGAGLSGLICAQQLRQTGYQVAVIEKSRGLGGRIATRRLSDACADHGVRYFDRQGDRTAALIQVLRDRGLLQPWIDTEYTLNGELQPTAPQPRYIAPTGMTAIAKALATGLDIHRSLRVVGLTATSAWRLTCEPAATVDAKAIVLAIPAPQATVLLESIHALPVDLLNAVQRVEFDSCLTVIATYSTQHQVAVVPWQAITVANDDFAWLGIDSSKRSIAPAPVVVLHSSAEFADRHFEADDLEPVGKHLLDRAAYLLPWLNTPETMQVHRWRYAFVRQPCPEAALVTTTPLPLVCCGDWCGGTNLEAALESGAAAAAAIDQQLNSRSPTLDIATLLDRL